MENCQEQHAQQQIQEYDSKIQEILQNTQYLATAIEFLEQFSQTYQEIHSQPIPNDIEPLKTTNLPIEDEQYHIVIHNKNLYKTAKTDPKTLLALDFQDKEKTYFLEGEKIFPACDQTFANIFGIMVANLDKETIQTELYEPAQDLFALACQEGIIETLIDSFPAFSIDLCRLYILQNRDPVNLVKVLKLSPETNKKLITLCIEELINAQDDQRLCTMSDYSRQVIKIDIYKHITDYLQGDTPKTQESIDYATEIFYTHLAQREEEIASCEKSPLSLALEQENYPEIIKIINAPYFEGFFCLVDFQGEVKAEQEIIAQNQEGILQNYPADSEITKQEFVEKLEKISQNHAPKLQKEALVRAINPPRNNKKSQTTPLPTPLSPKPSRPQTPTPQLTPF